MDYPDKTPTHFKTRVSYRASFGDKDIPTQYPRPILHMSMLYPKEDLQREPGPDPSTTASIDFTLGTEDLQSQGVPSTLTRSSLYP